MKGLFALLVSIKHFLDAVVRNRRLFFSIIGILILLLLVDINNVMRTRIPVKTYLVTKGNITVTVAAPGIVKATTAQMAARTPGRVDWIGVSEGDEVKKGQLLIKLDSYENALKEYNRIKTLKRKGYATSQQLDNARYNLDGAQIKSPIDGTVTNVPVEIGEPAIIGDPIITVTNSRGMYIELQIDQVDIGGLKRGQEVKITADSYPNEVFDGKLAFLSNQAELKSIDGRVRPDEEDKVFRAKVELVNPTTKLYHDMNVDTEIVTQTMNDVIVIPREGIDNEGDKFFAYFISFGRAHKKEVKMLLRDSFNVAVSDGVKEGDMIAVSNVNKLKDGSRIKIER